MERTMLCQTTSLTRRRLIGSAGAVFASAFIPKLAAAAGGRDARFVCIVLRGGLDGLAAVAPLGDPRYADLHGDIALKLDGPTPALPLDGFFALHPAMPVFARLYRSGQGAVVHAAATPYRERSHFDGQDVLESGYPAPGRVDSGWLNRLVAALPKGERVAPHAALGTRVLGVGTVAPLIARGAAPILGWAPSALPRADDDLAQRVMDLYAERDPILAKALAAGLETAQITASTAMEGAGGASRGGPDNPVGMRQIAEGAARLMAKDEGPRIAALALEGWDTHAREGGATGQLAQRLGGLDGALGSFEDIFKDRWKDTAIMVVTEFGRTVRINGTEGTDHGTGTVIFLAGGAVRGGRIIADWPGLSDAALHQGRDLKPTCDVRAVAKGVMAELFGVSAASLARDVFPDSAACTPMAGLVA